MLILLLFLATLWVMAFMIWLLGKWLPPSNHMRRPPVYTGKP